MTDAEPTDEDKQPGAASVDYGALLKEAGRPDQTTVDIQTASAEAESGTNMDRLNVISGLTPAKPGQIPRGRDYRFLITAAAQASPSELGTWLSGDGNGLHATDRPVNASLIDQDHNWTFVGENGFILTPPTDAAAIIAAKPVDIGSSDLEPQPIEFNAQKLLEATARTGYNQINIASGNLEGVYIRQDKNGRDLGNHQINEQLRAFAEQHDLPVVEIPVEPVSLKSGPTEIHELGAKAGNRLWKISIPRDDSLYEIDVIKIKPGDAPRGMQLDEQGFDLRIQQLDSYGQSVFLNRGSDALLQLRSQVEALLPTAPQTNHDAMVFAINRISDLMQPGN